MSTQQHGFPDGDMDTESEEMTTANHEAEDAQDQECFDPRTCCDERERLMIEAMRAYLRPQQAPECLYERWEDWGREWSRIWWPGSSGELRYSSRLGPFTFIAKAAHWVIYKKQ